MLSVANKSSKAREEYLRYIENAMSSLYLGGSLKVIHKCGKQASNEINLEDEDECMLNSDVGSNVV